MLGVNFNESTPFLLSLDFENCQLDFASFEKLKLQKIEFKSCSLQEVSFIETDLTSAIFMDCDLHRALFEYAVLEKADFRTAKNYSFDPEINRLKKAKFSMPAVVNLLSKYGIVIEG